MLFYKVEVLSDSSFYVRGMYRGSTREHPQTGAFMYFGNFIFKSMWLFITQVKENRKEMLIFSFGYLKAKPLSREERKLYLIPL